MHNRVFLDGENDPNATQESVRNDAIADLQDPEVVSGQLGRFQTDSPRAQQEQILSVSEASSVLRISNWRILWGLLVTNGSQKLTKVQYQAMRTISDTLRRIPRTGNYGGDVDLERKRIDVLPYYSTLFKN